MELRDVQFVIEAASEKMEIKKEIFRELAMEAGPKTIVATNTSALPVSELADMTVSPERVIGLHFFNPVSRMKLVEVVVAKQTSDETRDTRLAFVRQIGKLPVVVRDSPGFLVNRVLFPYLLDAAELFESGVDAEQIDRALVEWGMPMGPLRLIDEIGIDVTIDIGDTLEKAYGQRDHVAAILHRMREAKMLGRKTGAVFTNTKARRQTPNESLQQWRRDCGSRGAKAEQSTGVPTAVTRRADSPADVPDGERSRALRGRGSGRFARGRRLRNDSRDRLRAVSRRTVAIRGTFRIEEDRRGNGSARANRREIRAVRDFEEARARRDKILRG